MGYNRRISMSSLLDSKTTKIGVIYPITSMNPTPDRSCDLDKGMLSTQALGVTRVTSKVADSTLGCGLIHKDFR